LPQTGPYFPTHRPARKRISNKKIKEMRVFFCCCHKKKEEKTEQREKEKKPGFVNK
jgi:hypothetical protein